MREGYGFEMGKKIYIAVLLAFSAAVFFVYTQSQRGVFKVYDEFGIERRLFPYVKWEDFSGIFRAEAAEILDYKSFRTKTGSIITLCAASPLKAEASVEFLKKNIQGKPVIIFACGAPEDYSGIISAVVFYGGGAKCLNKDLYDRDFIDVRMSGAFLDEGEWFNAETD